MLKGGASSANTTSTAATRNPSQKATSEKVSETKTSKVEHKDRVAPNEWLLQARKAVEQHRLLDRNTAIFWAQLVYDCTNDPRDALVLAELHFLEGDYQDALHCLLRHSLTPSPIFKEYPIKAYARKNTCFSWDNESDKIVAIQACILSVECATKLNRIEEALTYFNTIPIQYCEKEPQIMLSRAKAMEKLGQTTDAKSLYLKVLACDPMNIQVWRHLIEDGILNKDEASEILKHNNFKCMDVLRTLYQSMLPLPFCENVSTLLGAILDLQDKFSLHSNTTLLLAKAKLHFHAWRYQACLQITTSIIKSNSMHMETLKLHIACLYRLRKDNALFSLAHKLIDAKPTSPVSWYAVGTYYLSKRQNQSSRKYFSKAVSLNSKFAEGWLGFGHTFREEGELDQAIYAYSTSKKWARHSFEPFLYIGMTYVSMGNDALAEEFLHQALAVNSQDPMVLNEMACLHIKKGNFKKAVQWLKDGLDALCSSELLADFNPASEEMPDSWQLWSNLGLAYLKLQEYQKSLMHYERASELRPSNSNVWTSIGLLKSLMDQRDEAIEYYHQAVLLDPKNTVASELLDQAIHGLQNTKSWQAAVVSTFSEDQSDEENVLGDILRARAAAKVVSSESDGMEESLSMGDDEEECTKAGNVDNHDLNTEQHGGSNTMFEDAVPWSIGHAALTDRSSAASITHSSHARTPSPHIHRSSKPRVPEIFRPVSHRLRNVDGIRSNVAIAFTGSADPFSADPITAEETATASSLPAPQGYNLKNTDLYSSDSDVVMAVGDDESF